MVTCLIPVYDPESGFKDLAIRLPRLFKVWEIIERYYTGTVYDSPMLTIGARGPEGLEGLPPYFVRYGELAPVFVGHYHLRGYLELLRIARSLDAS